MPLPNVEIPLLNGQTGSFVAIEDRVPGLILSGVAATSLALATPKQVFSLEEVVALGIDAAYDTTNTTDVYKQIKEFYDLAGKGQELWFMIVAKTVTLTFACDKTNDVAKKLLNAAGGRITLWGINRVPDGAYTPAVTNGFDDDAFTAIVKAHQLIEEFALEFKPSRCIIGARDYQGVPANLVNLKSSTYNRVALLLGNTSTSKSACVGLLLGKLCSIPVQRNPGRVKDGPVGINAAYFTNGVAIETSETSWNSIHDKGYIFFRKFPNKTGYYFTDDHTCVSDADDYAYLTRGFVIDKAQRIAYTTFVEEIQDDIAVEEDGTVNPAIIKTYQKNIENNIRRNMYPENISDVDCVITPVQDLIATNLFQVTKLGVTPKGYAKRINVPLGYNNPANA